MNETILTEPDKTSVVTTSGHERNLPNVGGDTDRKAGTDIVEELWRIPIMGLCATNDHDRSDVGCPPYKRMSSTIASRIGRDFAIVLIHGVPCQDNYIRPLHGGLIENEIGSTNYLNKFIGIDAEVKISSMEHLEHNIPL
jgi:hypothetical protein